MRIEDIRNGFSKASVVISNGVRVVYTITDRWVTQGFEEPQKMLELFSLSDAVSVKFRQQSIAIQFDGVGIDTEETVFYPPIKEEISLSALKEVLQDGEPCNNDFVSFVSGIDFSAPDEEIHRNFAEYFAAEKAKVRTVVSLGREKRFAEMVDVLNSIMKYGFLECEVTQPEGNNAGFIEINIDRDSDFPQKITGELKQQFERLFGLSAEVDLEISVTNGIISITVFND